MASRSKQPVIPVMPLILAHLVNTRKPASLTVEEYIAHLSANVTDRSCVNDDHDRSRYINTVEQWRQLYVQADGERMDLRSRLTEMYALKATEGDCDIVSPTKQRLAAGDQENLHASQRSGAKDEGKQASRIAKRTARALSSDSSTIAITSYHFTGIMMQSIQVARPDAKVVLDNIRLAVMNMGRLVKSVIPHEIHHTEKRRRVALGSLDTKKQKLSSKSSMQWLQAIMLLFPEVLHAYDMLVTVAGEDWHWQKAAHGIIELLGIFLDQILSSSIQSAPQKQDIGRLSRSSSQTIPKQRDYSRESDEHISTLDIPQTLCQILSKMCRSLNPTLFAQAEILDGYTYLLFSHVAAHMKHAASDQSDSTSPDPHSLNEGIFAQRAPYLIWLLKDLTAFLPPHTEPRQSSITSTVSTTSSQISEIPHLRLQETLLSSVLGKDFESAIKPVTYPDTSEYLLQTAWVPEEAKAQFKYEVWNVLGWESIKKHLEADREGLNVV